MSTRRTFKTRPYRPVSMKPYVAASKRAAFLKARSRPYPGAIARGRRRANIRIAGFLGIEKKFFDTWASNVILSAPTDCSGGEIQPEGGCTSCLSAPAQGDGEQNRDGKKITAKSIFISGNVRSAALADQADALAAPVVYVALVLDTQANGATVVSEQVFTNPNDTAFVNTMPLRNLQYSSRYRVLAHKTLNLAPTVATTDGANTTSIAPQQKPFTLSWTGELPITFTGTTADVANVADNALHLIAFNNNASWTACSISFNSRMRFVG